MATPFAQALNQKFKGNQRTTQAYHADSYSGDQHQWDHILSDPTFSSFANSAYSNHNGVAFRLNPQTGDKEMFIAGTRDGRQWALNALDTALYSADREATKLVKRVTLGQSKGHIKVFQELDMPRKRREREYAELARRNNVDVVYGHSRGGAMLADMDIEATKVGLDAAMLIADNKDMLNLYEGGGYNPMGIFDSIIGSTGEQNVTMDFSAWSPHKVWAT